MDNQLILAYIRRHQAREEGRRRRLFDYYRGEQDILRRVLKDGSKPNNRLAHCYPRLISESFTGYMLGEPVTYAAADEVLQDSVAACFRYNDESAEDALLGLDCSICGYAYEIHYIDADDNMRERFKRVDPVGCIAVRDDSIEERLTALIRYFDRKDLVTGAVTTIVEVYDAEVVSRYELAGGALVKREETPHLYGDVPVVEYRNNSTGQGDFETAISLIDAYDKMDSEGVNDQEYFSDAYMVIKGAMGTEDEDVDAMKVRRTILLPNDADAYFLTKQENAQQAETIMNRLKSDIHKFTSCPDMSDESFANNASGVAIKYKLLMFETVTKVKEREFKRGLQRRLELLCALWAARGGAAYDWRDVNISFKRALPENLLEISQTINNLGGIVSNETKRTLLPIEIDEEEEKARLSAESEAGMLEYMAASIGMSEDRAEEEESEGEAL